LEGTACHWSSTISDPADPGLAHGHNVKGSSWEKAIEGIPHFIGCAAGTYVLAPALFCLAIDWIMSRCSGSLGVTFGEAVFTDLDYADDAVFLHKIQEGGRQNSSVSMMPKPLWVCILRGKRQNYRALVTVLHLNQSPLMDTPVEVTDNCDKFVYLGSTVDSTGYSNTDILRRIGLASSVMGQLDRVWRQNRLSLATKLRNEDLHYMCPGSRPPWCRDLDAVEGRLTQAAGIPHDMPKTYSWH